MRAHEFLRENATAGATAAASVATVVKPLQKAGKDQNFFGTDPDDFPPYGSTVAIIRRPSPTNELKKNKG